MKYSIFFPKTVKREFKDDLSKNAVLLVKAGYVDQLMAGSYTLLPLGFAVLENFKAIIREELNSTGAYEMLMPLLHPREIWDQSGRWSDPEVKKIMYQFEDNRGKEYGLSFTHEEIVMNLMSKNVQSYKDLPLMIYHFSTKFRNEPRAKSGVLRGREFIMKDLYSVHVSEEDMYKYYEKVKVAYVNIFKKIGFDVKVTEAPGGVFTDKYTHEFQVLSDVGEDTIFYCDKCDFAKNDEIFDGKEEDKCQKCDGKIIKSNSIEVGNIFPLGTKYSEKMKVFYKDKDGNDKPIWFASYGIGVTRVLGAVAEVFSDENGLVLPGSLTPFYGSLIGIGKENEAEELEKKLYEKNIYVLNDDREVSVGEKFASADLLGFPYRLVISDNTGGKVEFKRRNEKETEILEIDEVITRIQKELGPRYQK